MTEVEITALALMAAILVVYPMIGLLTYRAHRAHRRRAACNRHVDAALALGQRRPQDSLNDARWPT